MEKLFGPCVSSTTCATGDLHHVEDAPRILAGLQQPGHDVQVVGLRAADDRVDQPGGLFLVQRSSLLRSTASSASLTPPYGTACSASPSMFIFTRLQAIS